MSDVIINMGNSCLSPDIIQNRIIKVIREPTKIKKIKIGDKYTLEISNINNNKVFKIKNCCQFLYSHNVHDNEKYILLDMTCNNENDMDQINILLLVLLIGITIPTDAVILYDKDEKKYRITLDEELLTVLKNFYSGGVCLEYYPFLSSVKYKTFETILNEHIKTVTTTKKIKCITPKILSTRILEHFIKLDTEQSVKIKINDKYVLTCDFEKQDAEIIVFRFKIKDCFSFRYVHDNKKNRNYLCINTNRIKCTEKKFNASNVLIFACLVCIPLQVNEINIFHTKHQKYIVDLDTNDAWKEIKDFFNDSKICFNTFPVFTQEIYINFEKFVKKHRRASITRVRNEKTYCDEYI